ARTPSPPPRPPSASWTGWWPASAGSPRTGATARERSAPLAPGAAERAMGETMRAQVLHEPGRMALTVRPIPRPSATEALVRVRRCGLCGSDVAYYAGRVPLGTPSGRGPLVLG